MVRVGVIQLKVGQDSVVRLPTPNLSSLIDLLRFPDLPGPVDLLRLTTAGLKAADQAIGLVPRVATLIFEVEAIVSRVNVLVGQLDRTHARAESVVTGAAGVTTRTETVLARVEPLLNRYEPTLMSLELMLTRLAETTSPAEVDAMVSLINAMPELVDKLNRDILPTLDTLGTVAPDLRDLLDVSKELNDILGSIPGLGRIKRRVDEQQVLEDGYRAAEEPPAKPLRKE